MLSKKSRVESRHGQSEWLLKGALAKLFGIPLFIQDRKYSNANVFDLGARTEKCHLHAALDIQFIRMTHRNLMQCKGRAQAFTPFAGAAQNPQSVPNARDLRLAHRSHHHKARMRHGEDL